MCESDLGNIRVICGRVVGFTAVLSRSSDLWVVASVRGSNVLLIYSKNMDGTKSYLKRSNVDSRYLPETYCSFTGDVESLLEE